MFVRLTNACLSCGFLCHVPALADKLDSVATTSHALTKLSAFCFDKSTKEDLDVLISHEEALQGSNTSEVDLRHCTVSVRAISSHGVDWDLAV